jgi:hypothetical protein
MPVSFLLAVTVAVRYINLRRRPNPPIVHSRSGADVAIGDASAGLVGSARVGVGYKTGTKKPDIKPLVPRTVLREGSGPATAAVVAGQSDLVLTLISEILPVTGLSLAGPIPEEFQGKIVFGGAANTKTASLDAATLFLQTSNHQLPHPCIKIAAWNRDCRADEPDGDERYLISVCSRSRAIGAVKKRAPHHAPPTPCFCDMLALRV